LCKDRIEAKQAREKGEGDSTTPAGILLKEIVRPGKPREKDIKKAVFLNII
jgi:hypothetical protein